MKRPPPRPPEPDPLASMDPFLRFVWGLFVFCVSVLVLGGICAALGLF